MMLPSVRSYGHMVEHGLWSGLAGPRAVSIGDYSEVPQGPVQVVVGASRGRRAETGAFDDVGSHGRVWRGESVRRG